MLAEAFRYITEHPGRTLWRILNRIRAFWGFDYVMSREIQKYYGLGSKGVVTIVLFEAGGYCVVMFLMLAGLIALWGNLVQGSARFALALAIGYQLPYTLAFSLGTYHFPVVGLLLPFAGAGLWGLLFAGPERRKEILRNKWLRLAALLFILIQIEYAYHIILMTDAV